jgi:hypothetical protein
MLVDMRICPWCDCRPERVWFVHVRNVNLKDAGKPYLELNRTVLVEVVIPDIFCTKMVRKISV